MDATLEIEEAQRIAIETVGRMPAKDVALSESVGYVLADDVKAGVDVPPFDKSAMDGYAVRFADLADLPASLAVVETIPAGRMPECHIEPGQAAQIMTGAPTPAGADTVVMFEHTERAGEADQVRIMRAPKAGANICIKGEDLKVAEVALPAGRRVRPSDVAVMAMVGRAHVRVIARPTVAIMSTGDEVVQVGRQPQGAQIIDSNSHALAARLDRLGITPRRLGIAPDEPDELRRCIQQGLQYDVLLISGGVSMGTRDLIPGMLEDCQVRLLFQKVDIKPGKPTVFGRHDGGCVFALPGNPVPVLVIAELLVVPALKAMMGYTQPMPSIETAVLEGELTHKGDRPSYRPVAICQGSDSLRAAPVEYHGSADLVGLTRGNALGIVPAGIKRIGPGALIEVVLLE